VKEHRVSARYRIRALRRSVTANTAQARNHAQLTEIYARAVERDMAEIARLEAEIDASTRTPRSPGQTGVKVSRR
jgi:hypothetical protein